MTHWTDERVEELLRDTFRAHEDLADAERAATLASAAVDRRRWPVIVSAAAAVALVAGGTTYLVSRSDEPAPPVASPTTSPTPPDPRDATTEDNIAAARAQAAWMLHAVPMPPGSQEWSESPNDHFRQVTLGVGPADSELRRTTWWTVPLPVQELRPWFADHQPDGLRLQRDEDGGVARGVREENAIFEADGTDAWSPAFVVFSYVPDGDEIAVRVDTFIGARFARTEYLAEDAIKVTVVRTEKQNFGPRGGYPEPVSSTVTDPDQISALVDLVNALPGSMTGESVHSCPAFPSEISYRLTFESPAQTSVVRFQLGCWPQVTLAVNGEATRPTLDPGEGFAEELDRYLD